MKIHPPFLAQKAILKKFFISESFFFKIKNLAPKLFEEKKI